MTASPPPLVPGSHVGDYELVRRLGRGGMAEVWCARRVSERKASKFVAIKVVDDKHVGDARFQRMFRSEAELSALLNHVNIVQVFDEGEDGGRSYLVMEWVDGVNLLKVGAALTFIDDEEWKLKIIAYVIGQILYALSYAHSVTLHDGNPLGIVHRDVSPQNVMVSNHGEVKLTDFGVAYYLLEESSGVHVKGKVRYMAPEQLAGKTRDPRIDLFAVGAILHELLDGRRFRHHVDDQRAMYLEVLGGKTPPLSRPVPPQLDALRRGLLEPDPADRIPSAEAALELLGTYPDYGDARRDLMQLCGGLTGVVRPRVGPGASRLYTKPSASTSGTEVASSPPAPQAAGPGLRPSEQAAASGSQPVAPAPSAAVEVLEDAPTLSRRGAAESRAHQLAAVGSSELTPIAAKSFGAPSVIAAAASNELRPTGFAVGPGGRLVRGVDDGALPTAVQQLLEARAGSGPIGIDTTDSMEVGATGTAVSSQTSGSAPAVAGHGPAGMGRRMLPLLLVLLSVTVAALGAAIAMRGSVGSGADEAEPLRAAVDPIGVGIDSAETDGRAAGSGGEAGSTGAEPLEGSDAGGSTEAAGTSGGASSEGSSSSTGDEPLGTTGAEGTDDGTPGSGDEGDADDGGGETVLVGEVSKSERRPPAKPKPPVEYGKLNVTLDTEGPFEVRAGRSRAVVPVMKIFDVPVGKVTVRWRRPGEPTWPNSKRVKVKAGCESVLFIPSKRTDILGTGCK